MKSEVRSSSEGQDTDKYWYILNSETLFHNRNNLIRHL